MKKHNAHELQYIERQRSKIRPVIDECFGPHPAPCTPYFVRPANILTEVVTDVAINQVRKDGGMDADEIVRHTRALALGGPFTDKEN